MTDQLPDPHIAALILNWRDSEATIECIQSVSESVAVNVEIYLLDNQSTASSRRKLLRGLEQVECPIHFFESDQNLGFAGGINYLVEAVDSANADYIFLLNNDATVYPRTLSRLVGEQRETGYHLIGPVNEGARSRSTRRWPYWLFGIRIPGLYKAEQNGWETCNIDGAGVLLTQQVVKRILEKRGKLLDDRYYLYTEDTELGLYARSLGYRSFITNLAHYFHTRGQYGTLERRSLTYYYTTRNRVFLAKDYLDSSVQLLFHLYYLLSRMVILGREFLKRNTAIATAVWEGLKDGYAGRGGKWRHHE
ncbi:glycosyltransferase family 2 protein [Halalkalibaculum sp. DA3122]|uniref:glycosyltransferase family 2 protein n=1 Tax=Halalkalibaculum sp. DA3122 TaxID=3373607 RepID=UPI003754591B